jgi:hypothetical protein
MCAGEGTPETEPNVWGGFPSSPLKYLPFFVPLSLLPLSCSNAPTKTSVFDAALFPQVQLHGRVYTTNVLVVRKREVFTYSAFSFSSFREKKRDEKMQRLSAFFPPPSSLLL